MQFRSGQVVLRRYGPEYWGLRAGEGGLIEGKGVMQLWVLPANVRPSGKELFMASTQGQAGEKRSWKDPEGSLRVCMHSISNNEEIKKNKKRKKHLAEKKKHNNCSIITRRSSSSSFPKSKTPRCLHTHTPLLPHFSHPAT